MRHPAFGLSPLICPSPLRTTNPSSLPLVTMTSAPPTPPNPAPPPRRLPSFPIPGPGPSPSPSPSPSPPAPPPRDARRVLVVGAAGKLGRAVVHALQASATRYSIVAVARAPSGVPPGCARVLGLDAVTQAPLLAAEAARLRCGAVVWCAGAAPGGADVPEKIDFEAVRDLVAGMDGMRGEEVGLVDLGTGEGVRMFGAVDDVVMGGRSRSGVRQGGEGDGGAPAVWSGVITTANRGGFVSVRARLAGEVGRGGVDLSDCAGIAVTCRGDGRRYKVNLKNEDRPESVFQAVFDTEKDGEWQTVRIPFDDFVPVVRGKLAYADDGSGAIYSATLDRSRILSVGLVCSKIEPGGMPCPKFEAGPFRLDLAKIVAYRPTTPRFILCSAAAAPRPFWPPAKKKLYRAAADIPIVRLNAQIGNMLGYKLAGEDALRTSGIPYAVVRATALDSGARPGARVQFSSGGFAAGKIARADVARVVVAALGAEEAAYKTFEISGDPAREWEPREAQEAMERLPLDTAQVLLPPNALG